MAKKRATGQTRTSKKESDVKKRARRKKRTPEEKADELIAAMKPDPKDDWGIKGRLKRMSTLRPIGLGLKEVPESLRSARWFAGLNLAGNKIIELPTWIGELTNLRALQLSENSLKALPPEIGALHGLAGLYLENNQLETLPEALTGMHP